MTDGDVKIRHDDVAMHVVIVRARLDAAALRAKWLHTPADCTTGQAARRHTRIQIETDREREREREQVAQRTSHCACNLSISLSTA